VIGMPPYIHFSTPHPFSKNNISIALFPSFLPIVVLPYRTHIGGRENRKESVL